MNNFGDKNYESSKFPQVNTRSPPRYPPDSLDFTPSLPLPSPHSLFALGSHPQDRTGSSPNEGRCPRLPSPHQIRFPAAQPRPEPLRITTTSRPHHDRAARRYATLQLHVQPQARHALCRHCDQLASPRDVARCPRRYPYTPSASFNASPAARNPQTAACSRCSPISLSTLTPRSYASH